MKINITESKNAVGKTSGKTSGNIVNVKAEVRILL